MLFICVAWQLSFHSVLPWNEILPDRRVLCWCADGRVWGERGHHSDGGHQHAGEPGCGAHSARPLRPPRCCAAARRARPPRDPRLLPPGEQRFEEVTPLTNVIICGSHTTKECRCHRQKSQKTIHISLIQTAGSNVGQLGERESVKSNYVVAGRELSKSNFCLTRALQIFEQ